MFDIASLNTKILSIVPEVYLGLSTFIILIYCLFNKNNKSIKIVSRVYDLMSIILLLTTVLTYYINYLSLSSFNNLFHLDSKVILIKLVLLIITFLILVSSKKYILQIVNASYEYIVIFMFSVLGMLLTISSFDFISLYINMELCVICVYMLLINRKTSLIKNEAAFKYFIISVVSGVVLLYGISFIYGITKDTNFLVIKTFFESYKDMNLVVIFTVILISIAILVKLGLAPFHMYVIDVYSNINYFLILLLNIVVKILFFMIFYKILSGPFYYLHNYFIYIIYAISALSIIIGNIGAIFQKNIVKILTFSSIANFGLILALLMDIDNVSLMPNVIIFLLTYSFANIAIIQIFMSLSKNTNSTFSIDDLKGLYYKHPVYAFIITVMLLSIAGVPPLGGFFAKFLIISELFSAKYYFLGILGVLMSLLGMFYYIRIIKSIYSKEEDVSLFDEANSESLAFKISLSFLSVFVIMFAVFFQYVYSFITKLIS